MIRLSVHLYEQPLSLFHTSSWENPFLTPFPSLGKVFPSLGLCPSFLHSHKELHIHPYFRLYCIQSRPSVWTFILEFGSVPFIYFLSLPVQFNFAKQNFLLWLIQVDEDFEPDRAP